MDRSQTDVIVIGAGIAGLVTAHECLEKGLSVQLVERSAAEDVGGLARQAFGGMALVDTPLQRRSGIRDSAELALGDWHSFADFEEHDEWPRRWAEYYVEQSRPRVYDWLTDKGMQYLPAVIWAERGMYHRGNSVPRYHVLWGTGHGLVQRFVELLDAHPAGDQLQMAFETRVTDLLESNGRIIGCRAVDETVGAEVEFTADTVVVATGGINGTLQRVRENWYRPWGDPPDEMLNGAHPNADGHVHDLVAEKGGVLTHLDKMWNYAAGIPHPQARFEDHGLSLIPCKSALWLDHRGERIGPEPLVTGFDTNELCRRVCELPVSHTWQVLNWRIASREFAISGSDHNPLIRDRRKFAYIKDALLGSDQLVRQMQDESDHFIVADDLKSLVAAMNDLNGSEIVEYDRVQRSIGEYDAIVSRGRAQWNDDQLRRIEHARAWRPDRVRTCKPAPILDRSAGPLIAIKLRLVTRKSLGGIQTDLASRVLDTAGQPIDGLLAVGEAAGFGGGGASGKASLEGTFLSGCILTARAAADAL